MLSKVVRARLTLAVTAESHPPAALNTSPKQQNLHTSTISTQPTLSD